MVLAIRIIRKYCSCLYPIGSIQHEYESLVAGGMTQPQAVKAIGCGKMCCRNCILNCPLYYIRDTNASAFTDETGLTTNGEQIRVVRSGPSATPRRPVPPFPALPGSETPMSPRRAATTAAPVGAVAAVKPITAPPIPLALASARSRLPFDLTARPAASVGAPTPAAGAGIPPPPSFNRLGPVALPVPSAGTRPPALNR